MEHHLDRKVVLGTEPEYKNLYSWFLREVGEDSKSAPDQIPWRWTQFFALTEMRLVSETEVECETNKDVSKISHKERIVAKMTSGYVRDGRFHREASYSMFGANRHIKKFELQIYPVADKDKQGCFADGYVSYTAEVDFRTETDSDAISFYLQVSEERFDRYVQQIREKSVTSAIFSVGRVAGFYSDWSPSVSTSRIKVLTPDKKNHPVEMPAGCEIDPPRLGFVGEADLRIYSTQPIILPVEDDLDDGSENDAPRADDGRGQYPPAYQSAKMADEKIVTVLESLRYAAWLIAFLLFIILIKR